MVIGTLNLSVAVPCVQGYFGDKLTTFTTQVAPSHLINLLGHDPRSSNWKRLTPDLREIYEYLQRKTNKARRDGPKHYIRNRIAEGSAVVGAFPPICIGVLRPLVFTSYAEKFGQRNMSEALGEVEFSLAQSDVRILLDGLSRLSAALDLADEQRANKEMVKDSFTFGVQIFAPTKGALTAEELGQLFHDFNFLATPVATGQAIDLDQSDPHIAVVNELAKRSVIADNGGMEKRAASLGAKSTALVAKKVLLRFVRGATEGPQYLHTLRDVPVDKSVVNLKNAILHANQLEHFLAELAAEMGDGRFRSRDSMHLTAPAWNALAVAYHDLFVTLEGITDKERDAIIRQIGRIDWSRGNPDWIGLLGDSAKDESGVEINENGRTRLGKLYGGQQAITKLVNYIRTKSDLGARLVQAGADAKYEPADLAEEAA